MPEEKTAMSQIQELEEKLRIMKQVEGLDIPDDLKAQFKNLVDTPKRSAPPASVSVEGKTENSGLAYNKPEYDEIIDSLAIDDGLKEKLKIVNHHFVKTSFITGAVYKGYSRRKMHKFGFGILTFLDYRKAGINKKWILMIPFGGMFGPWHYYPDLFRKLVLKEEDFWW